MKETGSEPAGAMQDLENWINDVSVDKRPVFTAFNATFDWMFVTYYFHRFLGRNPFRISRLDIKAYYMGKFGTTWAGTAKNNMDKKFLSGRKHTHNALDDAIEQAKIFRKLLEYDSKHAPPA